MQGDVTLVQQLLKQGFNPNVQDYAGWTPLVSLSLQHCYIPYNSFYVSLRFLLFATAVMNKFLYDVVTLGRVGCCDIVALGGSVS